MSNDITLIRYRLKDHSKRCLDVEPDWSELRKLCAAANEAGDKLVDLHRRLGIATTALREARGMVGHPDNQQIIDDALGELGV